MILCMLLRDFVEYEPTHYHSFKSAGNKLQSQSSYYNIIMRIVIRISRIFHVIPKFRFSLF